MKKEGNKILTETMEKGLLNLDRVDFWEVMKTIKQYEFKMNSERSKKGWKTKKKNQKMKVLKDYMNGWEEDDFKMKVDKNGNEEWLIKSITDFDDNGNEIWEYENCWESIDDSYSYKDVKCELIDCWIERYKLQKLLRELEIC